MLLQMIYIISKNKCNINLHKQEQNGMYVLYPLYQFSEKQHITINIINTTQNANMYIKPAEWNNGYNLSLFEKTAFKYVARTNIRQNHTRKHFLMIS